MVLDGVYCEVRWVKSTRTCVLAEKGSTNSNIRIAPVISFLFHNRGV